MASAGPYASLHLAPDKLPCQHPTTLFFTGRMPFLLPNQQCQSTEGNALLLGKYCQKIVRGILFVLHPVCSCGRHFKHTHPFNCTLSGTTRVGRYQKGKTNLDFTEARDSEWQWHQLGHMQVCTSLQADNHASTPLLSFLQAGCPSCRPTKSVKALNAKHWQAL